MSETQVQMNKNQRIAVLSSGHYIIMGTISGVQKSDKKLVNIVRIPR
jgi:hypothetical protein